MAAGKSTRASTKVTASSKASNGSEAAEVRASSKLKLQPADPTNCKISDNMADCCKTLCKVCRLCSIRNMTFSNARCAETLSVWLTWGTTLWVLTSCRSPSTRKNMDLLNCYRLFHYIPLWGRPHVRKHLFFFIKFKNGPWPLPPIKKCCIFSKGLLKSKQTFVATKFDKIVSKLVRKIYKFTLIFW